MEYSDISLTDEDFREIGNKIHHRREREGLTQEQLAERLNLAPNSVSRHENGGQINLLSLLKYKMYYGCQLDALLPTGFQSNEDPLRAYLNEMGVPMEKLEQVRKAIEDIIELAIPA